MLTAEHFDVTWYASVHYCLDSPDSSICFGVSLTHINKSLGSYPSMVPQCTATSMCCKRLPASRQYCLVWLKECCLPDFSTTEEEKSHILLQITIFSTRLHKQEVLRGPILLVWAPPSGSHVFWWMWIKENFVKKVLKNLNH